jgi:putative ABC transport system permease protein
MLKRYLKIAVRNLWKHGEYSLLNLFGLALAAATCIMILQYVGYELSFDRFHDDAERIYRVVNDRFQDGERVQKGTITYPAVGPAMAAEYPEVEAFSRLAYPGHVLLQQENKIHRVDDAFFVDEHFWSMFSFPLLAKERDTIQNNAWEVVLSASLARQFFDIFNDDFSKLLGETIHLQGQQQPFRIVGICEDFPVNSLLQANLLVSYASFIQMQGEGADISWEWSDFYHYLKLKPGTDVKALEEKFVDFSQRHFNGEEVSNAEERFYLQALRAAHLYSADLEYEIGHTANGRTVWAMMGIAFFILILAWVNYINLASVRAIERAKEVGIRRIVGAERWQLSFQFITESAIVNIGSIILGFLIAGWLQPWFANLTGIPLSFNTFLLGGGVQSLLLAGLFGWLVLSILLAGWYPAALLWQQQSTEVLKGRYQQSGNSHTLRRGLIIFQFAASVTLISVTWIAFRQLDYLNKKDLGVNMSTIVRVSGPELTPFDSLFIERVHAFKEALMASPAIHQATMSSRVPGDHTGRVFGVRQGGASQKNLTFSFVEVDHDYEDTYQLPVLAGRGLRRTDHHVNYQAISNLLINEQGAEALGYQNPDEGIGQQLSFWGKDWTIVGVLPDFHQESLHHPIAPTVYLPVYGSYQAFSVRIDAAQTDVALQHIEDAFARFFPGNIAEFQFLDKRFHQQYQSDQRFGAVLLFFTLLAILIACLGVLGMASYMAFLRTKEIGIRKVLGASVAQLVALLSRDFVRLAGIGALIAIPVAWYTAQKWLNNFSYKADIGFWIFPLGGLLAIVLAWFTVSIQSIKTALANPVDSLKND